MRDMGGSGVKLRGGFMRKECMELLAQWKKKRGRTY
jgi:hypothetical protein